MQSQPLYLAGEIDFPDENDVLTHLLDVFTLRTDENGALWGGVSPHPGGHVFGGQVMAQIIAAAYASVEPGRELHMISTQFLRPPRPDQPLRFAVHAERDGRSFASRSVDVFQDEKLMVSAQLSFQFAQPGVAYVHPMPQVPRPETLPSARTLLEKISHPVAHYWATQRPFDIRHVEETLYLTPAKEKSPMQNVWIKPHPRVSETNILPDHVQLTPREVEVAHGYSPADEEKVQRTYAPQVEVSIQQHQAHALRDALLVYASDYTAFEPSLRLHGKCWVDPSIRVATLNHTVWLHQRSDINDWLLYNHESLATTGGRSLMQGKFFTTDGKLAATIMQEGMFRV